MRFGLIGTGFWARTVHGPAVRDHPDCELAGVWGRDPGRADAAAAELGVRMVAELDTLLGDVDAVAIAVPPHVQARLAVRAAEHGCHLLLEKPVALDVAAADQVAEAAARAGVRAAVFHTYRYVTEVQQWLAALPADGWTGAHVHWLSSIYEPGSPYAQSVWRQDKGALWDLAPHVLSVLLPLLGAAESVVALPGPGDQADLVVRHASGAASTITVSLTAPPGARSLEWRIFGAGQTAIMPDSDDDDAPAAMANCVSALTAPAPHAVERYDLALGRDIVAVLAAAQDFLDRVPSSAATVQAAAAWPARCSP
jgi:predicted dehydrogenase